jgi:serine/threonine-protein kinase
VLGTTDYVSPEQALGQPVTGQSDLYSLGVVLYEMLTGEVPFRGENQVAVAMMHVRESLPDVQSRRPEVSSALAAVVDTATSKRAEDRYANDVELIADLEDVLAIETARAGSATGEVTTVLRTLPSSAQRRVPFRVRHRLATWLTAVVVLAAIAGVAVWLATRARHGAPQLGQHPPHTAALVSVHLCDTCAHGYNPLGSPTDEAPNAGLAIDGDTNTAWVTQQYYSRVLQKAGVGIYVDANPGTKARRMVIYTTTPGFNAQIYASNTMPAPTSGGAPGTSASGWHLVGSAANIHSPQAITLTSGGTPYRYWLLWITSLGGREQLAIDEIALYK